MAVLRAHVPARHVARVLGARCRIELPPLGCAPLREFDGTDIHADHPVAAHLGFPQQIVRRFLPFEERAVELVAVFEKDLERQIVLGFVPGNADDA